MGGSGGHSRGICGTNCSNDGSGLICRLSSSRRTWSRRWIAGGRDRIEIADIVDPIGHAHLPVLIIIVIVIVVVVVVVISKCR